MTAAIIFTAGSGFPGTKKPVPGWQNEFIHQVEYGDKNGEVDQYVLNQ